MVNHSKTLIKDYEPNVVLLLIYNGGEKSIWEKEEKHIIEENWS